MKERLSNLIPLGGFLGLMAVLSTPAFGKETYACFEEGADDPKPEKLVIAESSGSWRGSDETWEFHSESDFCNVSGISFRPESGLFITACFDRQGLSMHELWVQFSAVEGFEGDHFIASGRYRCVAVD